MALAAAPREREVVALRYCADLSVAEIAECMDTTPANVHQICSRALRRLRETVDPATGQPQQQLARESA